MQEFDNFNPLVSVIPIFTEEQLAVAEEWFDARSRPVLVINEDEPAVPAITITQFERYLAQRKIHRRSFHYPTYAEIMTEVDDLQMGKLRLLNKSQFLYLLNRWLLLPDMKHELALAFKVFDTEERGFLEIDLVKEIVTQYGLPFTDDELREFLRDCNVHGDGNVYYENFVDTMFVLAPRLANIKKEFLYEDPDEDPSVPPDKEQESEAPPPPPPPPPEPEPEPEEKSKKKKKKK